MEKPELENNQETSFFLYYPSIIPHAELVAPERFMEKFRKKFSPKTGYVANNNPLFVEIMDREYETSEDFHIWARK